MDSIQVYALTIASAADLCIYFGHFDHAHCSFVSVLLFIDHYCYNSKLIWQDSIIAAVASVPLMALMEQMYLHFGELYFACRTVHHFSASKIGVHNMDQHPQSARIYTKQIKGKIVDFDDQFYEHTNIHFGHSFMVSWDLYALKSSPINSNQWI